MKKVDEKDRTCANCFFKKKEYCSNPKVMLWDRGGYADFGVVSIANYRETNCYRDGKFLGVQYPKVPKFWKDARLDTRDTLDYHKGLTHLFGKGKG